MTTQEMYYSLIGMIFGFVIGFIAGHLVWF
jgi:hypothetical protein